MFPWFRCSAVLVIAALPLVACATPAERQLHKVSLASEQLWAQYDACMTQVERTVAYQRLDRAFILKRDDPQSIEKMTTDRLASDQEKADLLENKKNTSRCNQDLFKGFAEINPGFNVLLARFTSEDDELVLQTIQDNVTVGARNLIVHQRFAKRLRDWNFAGERMVRLYTRRLRRTCSFYCSSFSTASLLPTSTEGMSNVAAVTPPTPADGQAASLQRFETTAEPLTQGVETATAPAAQVSETAAVPAAQFAGSALKLPTLEVDIGLELAAGPADEPAKPQEQRVEVASTPKTAQPRYTIHLASMRSEVEARAEWGQLQARYPALLGDRALFTRELRISGQAIIVQVLTGLFHDRGQAQDLCSQFSSDEQYCAVFPAAGAREG